MSADSGTTPPGGRSRHDDDGSKIRRSLGPGGGRGHVGHEVEEELAFHVERLVEDLTAEGWDVEAARAEAGRRFGNVEEVGAELRRWGRLRKGTTMMKNFGSVVGQDVAYALRQWRRRPTVSALALATIALGVSAAVVVFAVVDVVVLRPLPFPAPDRMVAVTQVTPQGRRFSVSDPNFLDISERQGSFSALAAVQFVNHTLTGGEAAERVSGLRMSHTLPALAGVETVAGRTFLSEEDVSGGASDVVLLSEGAWTRRFGRDPGVVGRRLVLDGVPRTVVGVLASGRTWPGVEVFTPVSPDATADRDNSMLDVWARLRAGVTIDEARADVSAIGTALAVEYPDSNDGWGVDVMPLETWMVGPSLTRLGYLLLVSVGMLLLMACVSVSNIQVARATARSGEMAVRSALGAGRGRLAAQLAVEGSALAGAGAVLGVVMAYALLPVVRRLGPPDLARLQQAEVDGTVLAVAVAAAGLATILSTLAPAGLVLRRRGLETLRSGVGRVAGEGQRLRNALVGLQFALALVVAAGAGITARSFVELGRVELGFEPEGAVAFSVRLPDARYGPEERGAFLRRLQTEIEALPGVVAVGSTQSAPFARFRPSNFVAPTEREPDRREDFVPVSWRAVDGDYFEAAGIRVLAGRALRPSDFDPRIFDDDAGAPPSFGVVVDRTLADALFPDGSDPVGRSVTWFAPGGMQLPIVGVVATARDEWVDREPRPRIYVPYGFGPWAEPSVVVRAQGDPYALVPALRRAVATLDPDVPVIEPATLEGNLRDTVAWPRLAAQALAMFGGICLLLAALGIYGVTAFAVERRRREIGVRVALGAEPGQVLALVFRRALAVAGMGIGVGVAAALVLGRLVDGALFEVAGTDPPTLIAAAALLALVAAGAVWVPARRAVRTDPREALVTE